jgi:hypothetical protein
VVATGADVDLGRLPAPLLHGHDGGRFLNTYGINVARTPDGSWTNWSISRTQFMDARRMSGLVVPTQHLGVIHAMWRERGEDMPVAVAMGSSRRSRSWVGCRCPRTSTRRTSSARISASRSTSCAARRSTFSADWPAEIQERVLERWSEYGYRP